ncbi:hypothetical protein D3C79_1038380 [compost metagenome]
MSSVKSIKAPAFKISSIAASGIMTSGYLLDAIIVPILVFRSPTRNSSLKFTPVWSSSILPIVVSFVLTSFAPPAPLNIVKVTFSFAASPSLFFAP